MYVRPFVHHHDRWDILLVVDILKIFTLTLDLGSQLHASPYTCGCHTSSCSEIIIFTALAGRMTPSHKLYPLRTQPQPKEKERERVDRHTDRLNDSLTSGTPKKKKKIKELLFNFYNNNAKKKKKKKIKEKKKQQQQLDYVCLQWKFFKYPIFVWTIMMLRQAPLVCT
jgi:hypothetical protein